MGMEFVEGGDLLQCIVKDGCLTESQAQRLFKDLCEAVGYLHARNIIHRDLKPENILLTSRDRASMRIKIGDFGLARKNYRSRDCRTFCGTPHYFAPEVINTFKGKDDQDVGGGKVGYGKQADMWSLGVILYILLSGNPPFEDDGLYEQILEGKYEFDVDEWTTVSAEAKSFVRRLMTVNPKDRFTIEESLRHPWLHHHGALQSKDVNTDCSGPTVKRRRSEGSGSREGQAAPDLYSHCAKEHGPLGA